MSRLRIAAETRRAISHAHVLSSRSPSQIIDPCDPRASGTGLGRLAIRAWSIFRPSSTRSECSAPRHSAQASGPIASSTQPTTCARSVMKETLPYSDASFRSRVGFRRPRRPTCSRQGGRCAREYTGNAHSLHRAPNTVSSDAIALSASNTGAVASTAGGDAALHIDYASFTCGAGRGCR